MRYRCIKCDMTGTSGTHECAEDDRRLSPVFYYCHQPGCNGKMWPEPVVMHFRNVLVNLGCCPLCLEVPQMDGEGGGPFSTCSCGTGEDYAKRPLQRLQLLERRSKLDRDLLFDGYAVYQAMTDEAQARTTGHNVSDVLDALARLSK